MWLRLSSANGLVFQSYALFPHMTIGENIRFGMKQKTSESERRVADIMQEMDLSDMEEKFHELSVVSNNVVARALLPMHVLFCLMSFAGLDSQSS